jgi:hypothetical protein
MNIDLRPRALALNRTFRPQSGAPAGDPGSGYTFTNGVSNCPPADPGVFAAAVEGVVKRIVEGAGLEAGRPVQYWEFWNEPDLSYAWDRSVDDPMGRFVKTAVATLTRLGDYRRRSLLPQVRSLRFGLGSYASAKAAVQTLQDFDRAGGQVPMDFISFHAYSDDPLTIVNVIRQVAAARASTRSYRNVELALAEWGQDLNPNKPQPQTPMQQAISAVTVLSMGAALGLTHSHRSFLWDFHPPVDLGLLDNSGRPRPVASAYALLARVVGVRASRLPVMGAADGGLEGGRGACLVSSDRGRLRAILVNRNNEPRIAFLDPGWGPATPRSLVVLANEGELSMSRPRPDGSFVVPPQSVILAEF